MNGLAVSSLRSIDEFEMSYNDTAFQDLASFIDTLSHVVEYNGLKPLLGDGQGGTLTLSTPLGSDTILVSLASTESTVLLNGSVLDVATVSGANEAIEAIGIALDTLSTQQDTVTTYQTQFGCEL